MTQLLWVFLGGGCAYFFLYFFLYTFYFIMCSEGIRLAFTSLLWNNKRQKEMSKLCVWASVSVWNEKPPTGHPESHTFQQWMTTWRFCVLLMCFIVLWLLQATGTYNLGLCCLCLTALCFLQGSRVWVNHKDQLVPSTVNSCGDGTLALTTDYGEVRLSNLS